MKIRLEITMDNGITKDLQIQGIPSPEAILDLVNQLMSLQTTASPVSSYQSAAVQTNWPGPQQSNIRQMMPSQTSIYSSQPPIQKPTNQRGTRNLQLAEDEYSRLKNESLTIKERLELFLNFEYKDQWFTSLDVKRDYDRIYSSINLSTVSTYLSRMFREGKLERIGNRNRRQYCLKMDAQYHAPEPVRDRGIQTY